MQDPSAVFFLGTIILLGLAIWFFLRRKANHYYLSAFCVLSVTVVSNALLWDGTFVVLNAGGEPVYFTRWLFYIVSCALLMLTITEFLKVEKENILPILVMNTLVMLTGAVAAILLSPAKWFIFGLGCVFFVAQILLMFQNSANQARNRMVMTYIFAGWAVFPVIFFLAPEGLGLISNFTAAICYLVLDLFTKAVFYLHLIKLAR